MFLVIYINYLQKKTKKLGFKEISGKSRNVLKSWKLRNKGNF